MKSYELAEFETLRRCIFDLIRQSLALDGQCKSYEGALSIHFPSYFQDRNGEENGYAIHLDCYVIGPSRHYD